jgi:aminoglycoside phosphotransferase (APT) family kinase protein
MVSLLMSERSLEQSPTELAQQLQLVLDKRYRAGSFVSGLQRLTAGAAAQTWAFTLADGNGEDEFILRRGHDAHQFGGALNKADEARVISAAVAAGVPAPLPLLVLNPQDGLGEGFIMARIHGETLPQKILRDPAYAEARNSMGRQCGDILAAIHRVPLSDVSHLPNFAAAGQLDFYQQAYLGYQQALPVFEYAFRWLRKYRPEAERQTLVHGDFRNGNLMVGAEGIRSVLDWELAHIGDPMEDLGWLCVNSWRFGRIDKPVGGFGSREELYQAYELASGSVVDPLAVKYWEVFGVLKWGVICLYQCDSHLSGRERSLEKLAIGRRVSECELDIIDLLREA